jgi:hypothetical protein
LVDTIVVQSAVAALSITTAGPLRGRFNRLNQTLLRIAEKVGNNRRGINS